VTRELYHGGEIPERHDLTLFPTVNDLKNHIHQALKDIETGNLPLTAPSVSCLLYQIANKNNLLLGFDNITALVIIKLGCF